MPWVLSLIFCFVYPQNKNGKISLHIFRKSKQLLQKLHGEYFKNRKFLNDTEKAGWLC